MLAARRSMAADERALAASRVAEVAGASLASAERPAGYPDELPLLPGFEIVSGSVDPGVVRTAVLRYPLEPTALADALVARAATEGFTLARRESGPGGPIALRLERDALGFSVAVFTEGPGSTLQVIAAAPR